MELDEAIAQLEEAMKANAFFNLPEPHKVTELGTRRFDQWTVEEDGKNLECPTCKSNFNLKVISHVIPRKNSEEFRVCLSEFSASRKKGRRGIDSEEWAVCSEECRTILQLLLDGINERQQRELEALKESRKLTKAARKLASLRKDNKGSTPNS
jgi:hypothetical protein